MNGLDAVAIGITRFEGQTLSNRNYRNSNPGNLRRSRLTALQDDAGYCVFGSIMRGYLALLLDLRAKFDGNNDHGLTPDSTLFDLMSTYAPRFDKNDPQVYASYLAGFLQHWRMLPKLSKTPLREIWTPEDGMPWDSQLSQYLSI